MAPKRSSLILVLPVYNEEVDLPKNLPILHSFLTEKVTTLDWQIIIAEQASTDNTFAVGKRIAETYPHVICIHYDQKGRGGALKRAWGAFEADYYGYTDIDLSSQLDYLPKLVEAITNRYDIAIGSRLSKKSRVVGRTIVREIMSRTYNTMIRFLFGTHFDDAQCGFKIIRRSVLKSIVPHIKNENWFFDSELLIIAEKAGYRISPIPIEWKDDPDSTVWIAKTAAEDLRGLARLLRTRPWRRLKKTAMDTEHHAGMGS